MQIAQAARLRHHGRKQPGPDCSSGDTPPTTPALQLKGKSKSLRPGIDSERASLANAEPPSRRGRKRVLQHTTRRNVDRSAVSGGRCISLEECLIEQAHAPTVHLQTKRSEGVGVGVADTCTVRPSHLNRATSIIGAVACENGHDHRHIGMTTSGHRTT
jgi:hypothetical protein|eukprot:4667842-Prymnesium_polylepis.2